MFFDFLSSFCLIGHLHFVQLVLIFNKELISRVEHPIFPCFSMHPKLTHDTALQIKRFECNEKNDTYVGVNRDRRIRI